MTLSPREWGICHFPLSKWQVTQAMSVKIGSDGDFVTNHYSTSDSPKESNIVGDLYDVLQKSDFSTVTLAHEVRKFAGDSTDDSTDIVKWCNAPSEILLTEKTDAMDTEPNLGRLFYIGTEYTANDYTDYNGKYSSEADIKPIDECGSEGQHIKSHLIEMGIVESEETIYVPVNSDGEFIPPFVVSDERQEKADYDYSFPTYDEGVSRLEQLMDDHFGDVEVSEGSNDSDEQESDDSDDSDGENELLRGADGVGNDVSGNIREFIVNNRVTIDWREQIDAEEWHEQDAIVTKESARERLQQVALDMESDDFQKAMSLIEQGDTNQAVMAIEQYE